MAKKRRKVPGGERRRYDVQMIRDFLDNLIWELRVNHYEVASAAPAEYFGDPRGDNPELTEQLAKYMKKYNNAGLLSLNQLDVGGAEITEEQKAPSPRYLPSGKSGGSPEMDESSRKFAAPV